MENCDIVFNVNIIEKLEYRGQGIAEPQRALWEAQGHHPRAGLMYDMRNASQPVYTDFLIHWAERRGLSNVGVTYYKMLPGDNLPYHSDFYHRYIEVHQLQGRENDIRRIIIFPQDRQPGHIMEVGGYPYNWKAGDFVEWEFDTPHMAANMGTVPRYSIQLTGVVS